VVGTQRQLTDPEAAYDFIAGLYEANDLTIENLVTWLRDNVAPA